MKASEYESYVRPFPVEPKRVEDLWTTLFVFAFDAVRIDPGTACPRLAHVYET